MKKLIIALLGVSVAGAHAALTPVMQETFVGPGPLTSSSPGQFSSVSGTIYLVRVGPTTASVAAPGWSADVRVSTGANYRGTVNLTGAASTCGMWGGWFRIKTLPASGATISVLQLMNRSSTNVVMDFAIDSRGVISYPAYNYNGKTTTLTSPAITPNTWVWLAVAWQIQSGSNSPYGIRCMSMPLNGTLTTWGTADGLNGLDTSFSSVNVGLQTSGAGPVLRIGCPSLYSMASFSDIAYPGNITPPVEKSYRWYVNPVTGNDANDGSTLSTAWRTADKITAESHYSGMLDSNAVGPGGGDVLIIDTSGGVLPIGANTLTFATKGLKVQPALGQTYIKCQAEEILSKLSFTATAGLTKTYQTADTQPNVVAWDNDLWMSHVKSTAFGAAAAVTDPHTHVTTNYPSTGAALDAIPGSFYTDGTTLYIHPFGDTNPKTDSNSYTRSVYRAGASAAVNFIGGNYRAIGFYVRKTTLVDQNDGAFGAYCFQDSVPSGSNLSNSVEGCYFAYGDKHCLGWTSAVTNSTFLVLNTDCEQGNPYCGYGGQSPFVSDSGAATADNVHIFRGCTCLARSGLIGSVAGDPTGNGGDIIYSHNGGSGMSFASITLDDCNFASGSASLGVALHLYITNQSQVGLVNTYCPLNSIQDTKFPSQLVSMQTGSSQLTVQNCLIKPTFALSASPVYNGFLVFGNVVIEGCTFDLSRITGDSSTYFQGMIQRTGALSLTFRNNAYIVPDGQNMPLLDNALSSDTMIFDHNAYNLGSGTVLIRAYNNAASNLTFDQWRALGQDCSNSTLNANLNLQNDIPQSGSPLINGGVDLGSMTDVTGVLYAHRDTIGAYQTSAAYVAPQSIAGFPPLQTVYLTKNTVNLPATTTAGLLVTYAVVSGPARLSGDTLTVTGPGTVVLSAVQAGNSANAPLSDMENLTATTAPPPENDSPTMPMWGLLVLGLLLAITASRSLPARVH